MGWTRSFAKRERLIPGGDLEAERLRRYALPISQPSTPPSVYQLRVVLRGISPLIWRRLLVHSDTTLAHLHDIVQIVFAWSDEHLHAFHVHGKEYDSHGADTRHVPLSEFCFHRGEQFQYIYDFIAHWICDIRLEAILSLDPKRSYPICIAGKRAPRRRTAGVCGRTWSGSISITLIHR